MANLQKVKSDALAIIDSALAILNKFPNIDTTNTELSFNTSSNPFDMLLDAFKETAGYNILINIISRWIIIGIPPLEIAVKALLLSNIKNLLSCSINPFISEKLLREGIVFNLEQIDITDTLKYSPTSQNGQYYYFDNKNADGTFMIADELKNSSDFNCLLWFMKNRASYREVWKKKVSENGYQIEGNDDYWKVKKDNEGKCKKSAGIITLQFNERSQSLTTSTGTGMSIQTPYNNCIHVFLGNTQMKDMDEKGISRGEKETQILEKKCDIERNRLKKEHVIKLLEEYIKKNDNLDKQIVNNKISREKGEAQKVCNNDILQKAIDLIKNATVDSKIQEDFEKYIKQFEKEEYNSITNQLDKIKTLINDANEAQVDIYDCISKIVDLEKQLSSVLPGYRGIEQNYYYNRTLIEFNTDYVMSLRLFDSKVIAAQLIDSLVGLVNIDLNLSLKQQLIKSEIKKMIEMIIETDSTIVNDCFFTFTNDAYNDMLEKAELNRAKLFSVNGEFNGYTQIDPQKFLEKINGLSDDATQDGNISIIEHALTEISEELATTTTSQKTTINAGIMCNFIENLLNNLAYIIAASVLSPKVYLLFLVNLQILGQETNFSLEEFIGKFKQMIANLIKLLVNELIKFLMEELMKILGKIAVEISIKIGVEQAEYYSRLIKKIIDCFRSKGGTLDFDIDNVRHADIISEEITEKNTEC